MNILSVSGVSKIGREAPLFTDVSFGMNEGEKAALIGRNGTGKSTLLKTIAGLLVPDAGRITVSNSAGISYLPQNHDFCADDTIRTHIFKSRSPKLEIIREYIESCSLIGQHSFNQKRYDELLELMERQDLWNYEAQVSSILSSLGITDMSRKMGTLSGGMIKKVALAQVLVEDTKLLLLDEPTNHLDIPTIAWLEGVLKSTKRSVLMVTHDRYFLDAVCSDIFEISENRLHAYHGNYSAFLEKRRTEIEIRKNAERRLEAVLRVERDWLMRGPCARGTKAKARIKRDEQLINSEKFREEKGFSFDVSGRRLGGKVLVLDGISKSYPKGYVANTEKDFVPVIKDFSYTFTKGQKIGIFGGNGSGKSTLLGIVSGSLKSDTGSVSAGDNTAFGYYMQNPVFLDADLTVLDYVKETAEFIERKDGKTVSAEVFLEEFGFSGKIQHSPVNTLSGGEKKKLFLVRLLLSNPNFLILDEPTNDFDIFTMNILEDFLMRYEGCILLVTHDRYFMDKVTDSLFILEEDGSISGFAGKCSEYIDFLSEEKKKALEKAKENRRQNAENTYADSEPPNKKRKRSFKEQKEFESIEKDIADMEKRKSELETEMSATSIDFSCMEKNSKEYDLLLTELEEKYTRWEELADLE